MWKILNEKVPNDIKVQFRPESRLGVQAKIPPLNRASRPKNLSIYENSFAVLGPKLWNVLPSYLSVMKSESGFKNELTKYLKTLSDEPPVSGYARRNTNTLLEVDVIRGGHDL